ncbi:Phosphate-selective porin O and P [Rubritalea squalenifaciens DSM 18772]|uniref:Phosphate-selective porin O and P n=1 Tax=Rubritalea squalenifaciens DSM 18772 TaxID=1123071 RepID=A0A1M6PKM3_9BACT|nr:porin [Rubritalea squalenifaciens]SHK08453.1 Phosphate-selective porin O and P [Rubritalea squalenifaciens DSM 18772]
MYSTTPTMLALSALLCSFSQAGELAPAEENTSACDFLKSIGEVYKNDENPYIQELTFFGRFQWQYGYTEGEAMDGEDFDEQYTEIRRLRAGVEVDFLKYFELKTRLNLEQGGPDNHRLGVDDFDTATLSYKVDDLWGFEDVEVSYGRQKFTLGAESHESSRKIKTVERSNIGNYFYSGKRPTGLLVSAERFGAEFSAGIYSTEDDSDFIGGWNDSEAYYVGIEYGGWQADFLYNEVDVTDGEATEDDIFEFRWASSLAYQFEHGRWEILFNALYGELLDGEEVYGAVIMPSYFLIEDKLEAVMRYQYAGSDGNNLRLTKRYAQEAADTRKGDENHTIYAGLNYYFCGHRAKILTGVEYETLDRDNGQDADAVTFWTAFRMYF